VAGGFFLLGALNAAICRRKNMYGKDTIG